MGNTSVRNRSKIWVALACLWLSSAACGHDGKRAACAAGHDCDTRDECEEPDCDEDEDPGLTSDAGSPVDHADEDGATGPDASRTLDAEPDDAGSGEDVSSPQDAGGSGDAAAARPSPFAGSWVGKTGAGLDMGFTITRAGHVDSLVINVSLRLVNATCTGPAHALPPPAAISDDAFTLPIVFPGSSVTSQLRGRFAADGESASGDFDAYDKGYTIVCGSTLSIGSGGTILPKGTWSARRGELLRCKFLNDGYCDEPEGAGVCLEGTDLADCDPSRGPFCTGGKPCDAGSGSTTADASTRPSVDGGLDAGALLDGSLFVPGPDGSISVPFLDATLPGSWFDGSWDFPFDVSAPAVDSGDPAVLEQCVAQHYDRPDISQSCRSCMCSCNASVALACGAGCWNFYRCPVTCSDAGVGLCGAACLQGTPASELSAALDAFSCLSECGAECDWPPG